MQPQPPALRAWHAIVQSRDASQLADLLDDDVVFCSPAVFAPQAGRALTTAYLTAALAVLGPSLHYRHEWHDESSAVLEFQADLDGTVVHGVDLLRWNGEDRLTDFTVMVRPVRGLQELMARMAAQLGIALS